MTIEVAVGVAGGAISFIGVGFFDALKGLYSRSLKVSHRLGRSLPRVFIVDAFDIQGAFDFF